MTWDLWYHVPRSQVYEGSRGAQSGAVHLHAAEPVALGRIRREVGQSLCGKRGWYERIAHRGEVRCAECVRRAERYGVEWPS